MSPEAIDLNLLICPYCSSGIGKEEGNGILCSTCRREYQLVNGQLNFQDSPPEGLIRDRLDSLKSRLKPFEKLYSFFVYLLSPVRFYRPGYIDRTLRRLVKDDIEKKSLTAVNIGSGNTRISPSVINLDFISYDHVDIVADIYRLPFRSDSLDVVINVAVLEHLEHPEKAVEEILRVLKPGGRVYTYFPFIQGMHASPRDFSRRTGEGLKSLFHRFEIISIKPSGGPVSGFLWIFQEFMAILLSFGIKPLYRLLHILLMLGTFPLKYLDIVLIHHPMSSTISTGFSLVAKKI